MTSEDDDGTGSRWRWFLGADAASAFGTQFTVLALPTLAILSLHSSAMQVAMLLAAEFIPMALVGPLAGVTVDRVNRLGLLVTSDVLRAFFLGAIVLLATQGGMSLQVLYVVAAVLGSLSAFSDSAATAMVPTLRSTRELAAANAQRSAVQSLCRVAAPGLGGILISITTPVVAIAVDSLSYILASILHGILGARYRRAGRSGPDSHLKRKKSVRQDLVHATSTIRSSPVLSRSLLGMAILNVGGSGIGGLYAFYGLNVLGLSAGALGLTLPVMSLGALAGAAMSSKIAAWVGTGGACLLSATVASLSLFLIPLASLAVPVALLVAYQCVFGVFSAIWAILLVSIRQAAVSPEMLGRVNGIIGSVAALTFPVGVFAAGTLSSFWSVTGTLTIFACIAALAPLCYASRTFLKGANLAV